MVTLDVESLFIVLRSIGEKRNYRTNEYNEMMCMIWGFFLGGSNSIVLTSITGWISVSLGEREIIVLTSINQNTLVSWIYRTTEYNLERELDLEE